MTAAWVRARTELRRRRAATLAFIVLVGVVGGVVVASVAGGRRTDSAMTRFIAYNRPNDVFVASEDPNVATQATADVERLPEVETFDRRSYMTLTPVRADGRADVSQLGTVNPFAVTYGRLGTVMGRPIIVAGHHPDPNRPGDVAINEEMAKAYHLRPGGRFRMAAFTPAQADALNSPEPPAPAGATLTFTVVGIERRPYDLATVLNTSGEHGTYQGQRDVYLTPAFRRTHALDVGAFAGGSFIRLRPGVRPAAFVALVHQRFGNKLFVATSSDERAVGALIERAIHVQAVALYAFAGLAGLAGVLIIGQALARQVAVESSDFAVLRALGFDRRALAASVGIRAAIIAVGGSVVAVVLGVAASSLFPFGLAGRAELDPGVRLDVPVLLAGLVLVATWVLLRTTLAAWLVARPGRSTATSERARPSLAAGLAEAGLPPAAAAGVDMAVHAGRGTDAVPIRPALTGAAVAVAAVVAALTFAGSLNHLLGSARLQGWAWDVAGGNPNNPQEPGPIIAELRSNRSVAGMTAIGGLGRELDINGVHVPANGVRFVSGDVFAPLLSGRAPTGRDELVVGTKTLHDLRRRVGQTVGVEGRPMRIVGTAIFPAALSDSDQAFGEGAVVDYASLHAVAPDVLPAGVFLIRFRPGISTADGIRSLRPVFGRDVVARRTPIVLANLQRVSRLPFILAGLLGGLAIATIGHTLVTSVRRRRHDLAVLKTLGFVRGQIAATVAVQASTFAVVALVLGIPIGAGLGRWSWRIAANQLGTVSEPRIPIVALALAVPATLVIANLIAGVPALIGARVRPAVVLRTE